MGLSSFTMLKRRVGRQRADARGIQFHNSSKTRKKEVKTHCRQGPWVPALTEAVGSSPHYANTGPSAEPCPFLPGEHMGHPITTKMVSRMQSALYQCCLERNEML